ncbi:glycosyltransferase [Hymenobacter oligotrophus]|nr:glycosyltransferase [Hymenobacter oligotrophus]
MSSYNNARFVVEALESIKAQTYNNIELIVVDDCSKDNSVEIIDAWLLNNSIKFKFIKHNVNEGVCRVANDMLLNSRGKYMSIIASDDVFMPRKIEEQVAEFENLSDEYALLYGDVYIIDEDSQLKSDTLMNSRDPDFVKTYGDVFISLLNKNFIPGISTMVRTEALKKLGGFDENLFYEDWDMWLRLSRNYKVFFSNYIPSKYRIVSTSMWNTRSHKFYESTILLLKKHLGFSPEGDAIIYRHIREQAELLYRKGAKSATKYLKEAWKYYKVPSLGLLYCMSAVGLPYSVFDRLRRARG